MKQETVKRICCGDTRSCTVCNLNKALDDYPDKKLIKFVLNDLERCDFYSGPNAQKVKVSGVK